VLSCAVSVAPALRRCLFRPDQSRPRILHVFLGDLAGFRPHPPIWLRVRSPECPTTKPTPLLSDACECLPLPPVDSRRRRAVAPPRHRHGITVRQRPPQMHRVQHRSLSSMIVPSESIQCHCPAVTACRSRVAVPQIHQPGRPVGLPQLPLPLLHPSARPALSLGADGRVAETSKLDTGTPDAGNWLAAAKSVLRPITAIAHVETRMSPSHTLLANVV
jgi:hypothetical protein